MTPVTIKKMEHTLLANIYYTDRWVGLIHTSDLPIPKDDYIRLMAGETVEVDMVWKAKEGR